MAKQKFKAVIGEHKMLIYEVDLSNSYEMEFAKIFKEVARTKYATIQEFIIRLNDLQKEGNGRCPRANK